MPGFAADGSPYLPAPAAAGGPPLQPPPLLQAKWGYGLAKREQLLAACQHPLLRMPGMLLASKALSSSSVLSPPRLPQRLQWAASPGLDAKQLLKQGLAVAVSGPRPAAEPSGPASRPPRPAGSQRSAPAPKVNAQFVPTMPPAAAGAGAASATAIGLTVEQSMLLRMYQAQWAAAAQRHAETHVAAGPAAVYQQLLLQSAQQQQLQQQAAQAQQADGAPVLQALPAQYAAAHHLQQQLAGPYAAFLQQHIAAQQQQQQQAQQPAPMQP